MQLGNLKILLLLLIVPVLILFYYFSFKKKDRLIKLFVAEGLAGNLIAPEIRGRQKFKAFLLVMAVIFIIIALAKPRLGFKWEEIKRQGVDIIVAIDVSSSMLAKDVEPNRMERAKRKINDLLHMLEGDRIGLVAFAGTSFVQCPLTLDYSSVEMFLDYINTDLIPIPGTAITDAIKTSLETFAKNSRNKSKVLILITDGEDHEKDPLTAAKEAKDAGVKIFTIGIGKEGGVPIPDEGGNYKKDKNGDLILTRLDEGMLQKIALETGGSYVRSVTGDLDLEQIYINDIKKNMEKEEFKSSKKKRWEERFQWFILVALILIIVEFFIGEKGKKFFWIIFLVLIYSSSASAESVYSKAKKGEESFKEKNFEESLKKYNEALIDDPGNLDLKYNAGNAYYKTNNFEKAEKEFFDVLTKTKDKNLKEQALYNIGNTSFRQGKLEQAVDLYKKALEINPADQDAKYNLEFAEKELKKQEEEKKQDDKKSGDKNKDDKENKENKDQEKKSQDKDKKEGKKDEAKKEQEKSAGEKEKSAQQNKDENKEDGKPAQQMKLSKEEAIMLLDSLREERTTIINKQLKEKGQGIEVEKDW